MPAELQVRLLRVLEDGRVSRVGAERDFPVDVRVIAATNRAPAEAVAEKLLRQDLYFRLNVFPLALPPLREREADIELLAATFLKELNDGERTRKSLSRAAFQRLRRYEWPGNVRELRNVIQRAFILASDEIQESHLGELSQPELGNAQELTIALGSSIADVERRLILATLEQHQGSKERAAGILGISIKTLYTRLNQYKGT